MNKLIIKILLIVIVIATLGFLVGVPYYENTIIAEKIDQLKSSENKNSVSQSFKSSMFGQLPISVKKFLRKAIKNKVESPVISHINLSGKIRISQNSEWLDTKSAIHYSTVSPGFVDVTEIYNSYLLYEKTVKIYIDNFASTNTKYISSIPVSDFAGNKLNRSYLVLYLMESIFSPTVLLPNRNIQWKRVSNNSAKAIIWDKNIERSAVFHFNSKNEVTKITSKDRYMPGKLDYKRETFTIHLANYKDVGNYYIPTYFEFEWNLAGSDFTFGKFQIDEITYE